MTYKDPLLEILSMHDDMKLRAALYNLVDSLKGCSIEQLHMLNKAGRLPDLCMQHVINVGGPRCKT